MSVKANFKITKLTSLLSVLGLVLLLLLSPCKVRNFIQAELGLSQTNVLNKSQTTISSFNCLTFELSEKTQSVSKLTFQQSDIPVTEVFSVLLPADLSKHSFDLNTSKSQQAVDVPFYILYQNLKIYS